MWTCGHGGVCVCRQRLSCVRMHALAERVGLWECVTKQMLRKIHETCSHCGRKFSANSVFRTQRWNRFSYEPVHIRCWLTHNCHEIVDTFDQKDSFNSEGTSTCAFSMPFTFNDCLFKLLLRQQSISTHRFITYQNCNLIWAADGRRIYGVNVAHCASLSIVLWNQFSLIASLWCKNVVFLFRSQSNFKWFQAIKSIY